jgi:site-specific DNA-methyltransferase (adenine-specific)
VIHHGDCLDVMATLDAGSVDAVATDPPYDLTGHRWDSLGAGEAPKQTAHIKGRGGFMGKSWDGTGVAFNPATWAAALRVTAPGGYLLAFGGTRTYHRMTCAIEDAGWIIRDCLVWAYASGFPKSKALLKPAWEPIVMARKPGPLRELAIDACRIGTEPTTTIRSGHSGDNGILGTDHHTFTRENAGRWPANVILTDPIFDGDTPGVVGGGWQAGGGNPAWRSTEALDGSYHGNFGGGDTGLAPTDTEGTYSRFFIIPKADRAEREPVLGGLPTTDATRVESAHSTVCAKCGRQRVNVPGAACVCHDPEWVRKPQTARANHHPTVKPLDLMRHLVRLVTPVGGTVLDPFLGSGTTALAAEMEGFAWIGIEREAEYVAIAEARLNGTQRGMGLGA